MMRWNLLSRGPILMSIFPFSRDNDYFDNPVSEIKSKPLKDELAWDRLKNIYHLTEDGMFTKELQSIINITLSGFIVGVAIGGANASRDTVHNFISHNEATKFVSEFDAKRSLQTEVSKSFIAKGGKLGLKLGFFSFMFSTVTTCTTVYRGKIAVENYILGAALTGLLFKVNLGFRAALVGAGLGSILGGLCGVSLIAILQLTNVNLDEVLTVQQQWISSRDEKIRKKVKEHMADELPEVKQLYHNNLKFRVLQQKKVETHDK